MNKSIKIKLNKLWKNRNSKQRSFLLTVVVPTLIVAIYFVFICADRYVVESKFAIKGNELQQLNLLSGIAGMPGQGGTATDSYILQEYLASREIIEALAEDIDLETLFNNPNADFFSRLGYGKSSEDKVQYWNKMVTSSYDPTTTITSLKIRTFTPEEAVTLSNLIIEKSSILINSLSEQAKQDDLKFAQNEVLLAEQRVANSRLSMTDFRNQYQELDPTQTAITKLTIIGELESKLAALEAKKINALSYMSKHAPAVNSIANEIDALRKQINNEKENIAGKIKPEGQNQLSAVVANYEPLLIERTFAEKAYASTLASLEGARMEAAKKNRYLSSFVLPKLPEESVEPNRVKSTVTIFLGLSVLWGIGILLIGSLKEHIGWV